MGKKVVALTGHPGSGKTTVVVKVARILKDEGIRVGGMVTSDIRKGGSRVGFEVTDLDTGTRGVLADVSKDDGPRIGRYTVRLDDLENIGVNAISRAIADPSIRAVIVDEVGPMELFSDKFEAIVAKLLDSGKPSVITVHQRARHKLVDTIKSLSNPTLLVVTKDNRDHLPYEISKIVKRWVRVDEVT